MGFPFTEQLSQGLAVMGYIPPTNHASGADTSIAGIDMSNIRRLLTIIDVGVLGTNANIQCYYNASAYSNMASPTNVASSIPLTTNTANRANTLEVRADQLPAGTRYVQPNILVNTAASFISAVCLGAAANYEPTNQFQVANTTDQQAVT